MKSSIFRPIPLVLSFAFSSALFAARPIEAQQSFKVEKIKDGPPTELASPIKAAIKGPGYRVTDDQGKPFVELWLRDATPATSKPSGPKGAILFPVLSDGELVGAIKFLAEGHDYRDQTIAPGVYTLRYLLQPINGDHLGTSDTRDFVVLVPSAKDKNLAPIVRKPLEERSAEAAGSSHPAVFLLREAPDRKLPAEPLMVHDEMLNTWGAVLGLPLKVPNESKQVVLPIQVVVSGSKAA